jgi:hypothetical protein
MGGPVRSTRAERCDGLKARAPAPPRARAMKESKQAVFSRSPRSHARYLQRSTVGQSNTEKDKSGSHGTWEMGPGASSTPGAPSPHFLKRGLKYRAQRTLHFYLFWLQTCRDSMSGPHMCPTCHRGTQRERRTERHTRQRAEVLLLGAGQVSTFDGCDPLSPLSHEEIFLPSRSKDSTAQKKRLPEC